jgi:hypothetical protein
MHPRLHAVCDLMVPTARESAGLHAYDGRIQDLSPAGVRTGLAALGGDVLPDAHDEAHLAAFEAALRLELGVLHEHRRNPLYHLENLDLAVYDREYAPAAQRDTARREHLARWPDAVDMAVESLDAVPRTVADGLAGAIDGLAVGLADRAAQEGDDLVGAALAAQRRFADHVAEAAVHGDPDPAIGAQALAKLLGTAEAMDVDLGRLAVQAEAERDRLRALLTDACGALGFDGPVDAAVAALVADHPTIDGVLEEARALTEEVLAFTAASGMFPDHEGECRVGPAPASRSWAMAMLSPAAAHEEDGPSWYHVTPPDPTWPADEQQAWLSVFSRTTLPAVTVHEVAPGHFSHFCIIRQARGDVRRTLYSTSFAEGWAHYVEELLLEEGFRSHDPRYAAGVAIEALVRVTRLSVSIGLHTGAMDMDEAERRFTDDAFLHGPAARSEAVRATFDPGYGRYTWGKLEIMRLRDRARHRWGSGYSHQRFHAALLSLGSPPLGLMDAALIDG